VLTSGIAGRALRVRLPSFAEQPRIRGRGDVDTATGRGSMVCTAMAALARRRLEIERELPGGTVARGARPSPTPRSATRYASSRRAAGHPGRPDPGYDQGTLLHPRKRSQLAPTTVSAGAGRRNGAERRLLPHGTCHRT